MPSIFSDCVSKFSIYHQHYKKKLNINNLTQNFACNVKPGLVTKKEKLPKISLYFLSDAFQLPSFMISLTLSKMRSLFFKHLAIFKCILIFIWQLSFKYTLISKWQFSLTLASFALLAVSLLVKLTSKASSNLSCLA